MAAEFGWTAEFGCRSAWNLAESLASVCASMAHHHQTTLIEETSTGYFTDQ